MKRADARYVLIVISSSWPQYSSEIRSAFQIFFAHFCHFVDIKRREPNKRNKTWPKDLYPIRIYSWGKSRRLLMSSFKSFKLSGIEKMEDNLMSADPLSKYQTCHKIWVMGRKALFLALHHPHSSSTFLDVYSMYVSGFPSIYLLSQNKQSKNKIYQVTNVKIKIKI